LLYGSKCDDDKYKSENVNTMGFSVVRVIYAQNPTTDHPETTHIVGYLSDEDVYSIIFPQRQYAKLSFNSEFYL